MLAEPGSDQAAIWSSQPRAFVIRAATASDLETTADTPAARASFSTKGSLWAVKIITGTAGMSFLHPGFFQSAHDRHCKVVTIKLGRQLSLFDCVHPIFSLSAYVKAFFAVEPFAIR
jgi:hypothetical protein